MIKIECLLTAWSGYCNQKCNPLSRVAIQTEPLNVFKRVKERNDDTEETFACVDWFEQFKNQIKLHSVKTTYEMASAKENASYV
jgi:hypothetical protein